MLEIESKEEFEAYARACLYEKMTDEQFYFIMEDWGQELVNKHPFLNTKEFEYRFKISRQKQKEYRGRAVDALPYRKERDCANCLVLYETEKILKWLERNFPDAMI